jgi:hypothetical protein
VDYQGAQQACKDMKVPCKIIRVPQVIFLSRNIKLIGSSRMVLTADTSQCLYMQAGHFAFMDNPSAFESAVFYASQDFLSRDSEEGLSLPDGLTFA